MGNSSSQPTVLQQMADGKKPLAAQAVDRADVVGDNCIDGTKESLSPNQGIPRNSFRSLLLARKGYTIIYITCLIFQQTNLQTSQFANHSCTKIPLKAII